MFRNSQGEPDFLMTSSALALAVVLGKALASGAVVGAYQFGTLDAATAGAILAPTFVAYTAKRIQLGKETAP
jgi:hypothetical protein